MTIETPEGRIYLRLECEMGPVRSNNSGRMAVHFQMIALPAEFQMEMPKLECSSACGGIYMHSSNLFRPPGTYFRPSGFDSYPHGLLANAVLEDDLKAELSIESAPNPTSYPSHVKNTANALRRLEAGGTVNFFFALKTSGLKFSVFGGGSEDEDTEEDAEEAEEESAETDAEVDG